MLHDFKIDINKDANDKFTSTVSSHEPDVCMADYVYLCMEALDTQELLDAIGRLHAFLTATGWSDMAKRVKSVEKVVRDTSPEDDEVIHDMACCWLSHMQRKMFHDLVDGEYSGN